MTDHPRLTVSQAAAALGISERTVRRRCASGKLAAQMVSTETGATWLIPIDALELRSSEIQPAEPAAAPPAIAAPDLARLESDVAQIKAFLAGQMTTTIQELKAENARLRAELAAERPQPDRSWLANLLNRK